MTNTLGNPCEYGCAGPCEDTEHWRYRAEYLARAVRNMHESREAWRDDAEGMFTDRDRWREEAWRCYLATGADPDGDDARHLQPGEALRAVENLRREADGEGATLGSTVDALIAEIDSGAHPAEDAALVVGQLIRWREAKYPVGDGSDLRRQCKDGDREQWLALRKLRQESDRG